MYETIIKTDEQTNIKFYANNISYCISVKLVEDLKQLTNNKNINESALLDRLHKHFINLTSKELLQKVKTIKLKIGKKFYKLPYMATVLKSGMTFVSVDEQY